MSELDMLLELQRLNTLNEQILMKKMSESLESPTKIQKLNNQIVKAVSQDYNVEEK